MDLGLKDKVVMVAASSKGLGYGIALEAAREGAILSLGSRNQKNLKSAAKRIEAEAPGTRILTSRLDVAKASSIEEWVNYTLKELGSIDCLKELDLRSSREWRISLDNVRKINFDKIPMGRYGEAQEFGKAAIFLLSEAASYVTGETFIIDGGKMRTVW